MQQGMVVNSTELDPRTYEQNYEGQFRRCNGILLGLNYATYELLL